MKILVAVKEVAEVEDTFEVADNQIDDRYLEYNLNEWDDYAIEAAVQLGEEHDDVEVVSVTVGTSRAEETIRMALAKGVDRSIRIWDDAIDSADYLDIASKATLLGAVVEAENPDLVFTGVQSADESNGAIGVSLAETVGFDWASVVTEFDLDVATGSVRVHRELEGGISEIVDLKLPAVLTVQSGINNPRYASLRGIRQAQGKPIEILGLADLELNPAIVDSPITRTALYEPKSESQAEFWEGSPDQLAEDLATLLRETGVVAE